MMPYITGTDDDDEDVEEDEPKYKCEICGATFNKNEYGSICPECGTGFAVSEVKPRRSGPNIQ